ncbi:uncharacterized protein isoform X5 [Musca autumnalis]|uniref:uncharacterized protein isoform X5 n=1 Tax=Musca autumnalis TaxID=221902 RepID=UPI003CFB3CCD
MSARRSASVGALPQEKKHFVSRNESTGGITLDVRCACQYFQSDSLLPERVNPVDSRPNSRLDFQHDPQCTEYAYEEQQRAAASSPRPPPLAMHSISGDRKLLAGERVTLPDPERQSMRSMGKHHRSWDQASASVDISFVEKYPELEDTAKRRGLVVRSISDDDPQQQQHLSRSRQRFTSVDRMSNASGGGVGHRDPETMSMHSVRSLRRISRSPSKGDLFVADINIEQPQRREQRSVSASRRSSNMDLYHSMPPQINVITPTPLPQMTNQPPSFQQRQFTPQIIDQPPANLQRQFTPLRSPSPPGAMDTPAGDTDYRIAKKPVSVDYMRPEDNKENRGFVSNLPGEVRPQNRPIDVSKYKTGEENSTIVQQQPYQAIGLTQTRPSALAAAPLPRPHDPLEETVAELEAIVAAQPIEQVSDDIKIKRLSPPLVEDVPRPSLHLDEETVIEIKRQLNVVDIDKLVQEEEAKARERAKSKSPTRSMQRFSSPSRQMERFSPTRQEERFSPSREVPSERFSPARSMQRFSSPARQMERFSPSREVRSERFSPSREVPSERFSPSRQLPSRSLSERFSPSRQRDQLSPSRQMDSLQLPQQQLKRGHSPERQTPSSTVKKIASEQDIHQLAAAAEDPNKASYSSRFKSFFSGKAKEEVGDLPEPTAAGRERTPSPAPSILRKPSFLSRDKAAGQREKSPSPAPSAFRMPNIFSKNGKYHEKSPSPMPREKPKKMSIFSSAKPMPVASAIISGNSAATITKKPDAEPMSIKVQETFSLKVDEMDQYMAKPAKPPAPPAPAAQTLSKSPSIPQSINSPDAVEYAEPEIVSTMNVREAFAPVIIGRSSSSQLSIDQQRQLAAQFSSQERGLNMRSWGSREASVRRQPSDAQGSWGSREASVRRQPSDAQGSWGSREPSIHHHPELQGKPLFSAAIMMDSSGSLPHSVSPDRSRHMHGLRSPSEQRPMQQQTKQKFLDGRTQSQDRQPLTDSQDYLASARMTKTVSFHFDERKSRLSEFENRSGVANRPAAAAGRSDYSDRVYHGRDHEYEPIGMPSSEDKQSSSEVKDQHTTESQMAAAEEPTKTAEDYQREIEEQFFKPAPGKPTPQTELTIEAGDEEEPIPDDAEAMEEAGQAKSGGAMKNFMASAQDRGRKMQMGLKTQAGKLRTKFKATPKKSPSSSPKAKERRKFKAPEFSKMKMPDIKRPDMAKFKDFKRPEFTKFSKPDMSKFKLPEMSGIKLGRSKSFKESEATPTDEDMSLEAASTKRDSAETSTSPQKKLFDFNFGTYPRVLRKKKKPIEPESSFDTGTATEATSVIPSTATQPSVESSSSPQGDRGPGPVRSRWADKFSDVSFNDSEGSRYRRYGSELESFDRESSLERRMREDLEDTVSEEPHDSGDMGILSGVTDNKEFAEFDEENRAIHEISNLRSREFKRRPIVHQDSDVRSEEDAVGWTEKEIQKNILLHKAEAEAEASYHKYDDQGRHDTQSTASSGKKVVLEEISEDEFFLRKRGISQDNIEINQYIRQALRQGGDDYDKPINSLQHVGQTRDYGDYDVPPPKPRRLHKVYQPTNDSQEFGSYGDNYSVSQNGSDYFSGGGSGGAQPPRRPMRKSRSRSKYSVDSQDVRYMDEEYLREPSHENVSGVWNDLNMSSGGGLGVEGRVGKENIPVRHEHHLEDDNEGDDISRPQPPRRQKRRRDTSMDKDSYINGFGGRSVSNSYLQPTEDVIVYRTEHEYHHVPIATPDKYSDSVSVNKSTSHYDLDDQPTRGALTLGQDDEAIDVTDKYVIEMLENDGYAVVRKEQIPKPTPPARRKRFAHLPGDRYATMPNMRTKRSTPPPERPPPPRGYTPVSDVVMPTIRKSALSLDARPNYRDDDYEEPGRPESPRNLQSGDIINKMKYRPLPPPPRPPREKRNRSMSKGSEAAKHQPGGADEVDIVDGIESDATAERQFEEVEASTQTDPLPDDFVCEEFEITDDMKIIEPRIIPKTIEEMLQEELEKELENVNHQVIDSEQLARGLQRFRESNQRSLSERSRASSQADRSKSQSRPQTPSAILVERQSSTPVMKDNNEPMLEASLIVRPIDDLELEEEELRREGLLTDESQHSGITEHKDELHVPVSEASYAPSSTDIDDALGHLPSDQETQQTDEEVERTLQRYRDELDEIGRQLMEAQTTSQEDIRESDREERSEKWDVSDREEASEEKWDHSDREEMLREPWQLSDIEEMRSDLEEITSEREEPKSDMELMSEREEELKSDMEEIAMEMEKEQMKYETEAPIAEDKQEVEHEEQLQEEAGEEEEEEEIPFEKEFTPLATPSYRVDTPTTPAPMPPPRRKSTTAIDLRFEDEQPEAKEETKEVAIMQTVAQTEQPVATSTTGLPAHISELEVERLRVHALQAGQIMVSQLHGQQIVSEELECKSGNIVVKNIELPPGLIEDIVERVRQTERSQHLTIETQTSPQNSSNEPSPQREVVPPPKPPRLRDLEAKAKQSEPVAVAKPPPNTDEQTQTDVEPATAPTAVPPPLPATVFPSAEYLQQLAPLAFYNLHRAQADMAEQSERIRRRRSVSPAGDEVHKTGDSSDETVPRRRRTRSARTPSPEDPQSVTKAGRKFITACSLSLAKIINQLTDYIRGKEPKEGVEDGTDVSTRHVPALAVLFIVITFCVLIFLLTGRNVHTHHWDYFNPPGQEGRPS